MYCKPTNTKKTAQIAKKMSKIVNFNNKIVAFFSSMLIRYRIHCRFDANYRLDTGIKSAV